MRTVIIVLIVIAVAFVAVAVLGGRRSEGTAGDGAPPQKNGEVDEDSLSSWTPPSTAKIIATISAPFAPGVEIANRRITLAPGASDTRMVPSYNPRFGSNIRTARIEVSSGGMRIQYDCTPQNGRRCPQAVCICAPRATFTALQIASCPEGWRRKLNGAACTKDDDNASLVVYPEPGTLTFAALGQTGVSAEIK